MRKEKSRSPPKRSNGIYPNRQNKKSQLKNLSNIERNEVKQYGNEICRARYDTVFWNS